MERLHGTTLVFSTIRTGFPTAEIAVVDRNSLPEAREIIKSAAEDVGAKFLQLDNEPTHATFISHVIQNHKTGPLVICDPDVIFWQSMEDLQFSGVMAGRLTPQYTCPFTGCITCTHPSLLWIQAGNKMRELLVKQHPSGPFSFFSPFGQQMFSLEGKWYFFDTASSLYCAAPGLMQPFNKEVLDRYDHLFCGSYKNILNPESNPEVIEVLDSIDKQAQTDFTKLKGIWKIQDEIFRTLA